MDEHARLLSRLATTLAALPTDRPQAWRLGEAVRRLVSAKGAAITIDYLSENRTTVCATDAIVEELDSLQELLGEGPGYDAARNEEAVDAVLDGRDPRWPLLQQAAAERFGPLRIWAVPLHSGTDLLSGVAILYTEDAPLQESLEHLRFLLQAVGAALVIDAQHHLTEEEDFTGPWSSRAVVHQATGMVMAQLRVSPEDALTLLRGQAYAQTTDLHDVAGQVVERRINFSDYEVEGD